MRNIREGSSAFNLGYDHDPNITYLELREDILSYLCEYRLGEQKHKYSLSFLKNRPPGFKLCDSHRFESMGKRANRAILEREANGESVLREQAELLGILKLEDQLGFAQDGDVVVWASPPGPENEGYDRSYGFFYLGLVEKRNDADKSISMTAIRIGYPTLENCNTAFNRLTGENVDYPEGEFLANPRVVRGLKLAVVDGVLHDVFSFKNDERHQQIVRKVLAQMGPMIDEFISLLRNGTKEEKEKAFYALENYALRLKREYEGLGIENIVQIDDYRRVKLGDILPVYGYEPPVMGGSCGGTGKKRSNDILGSGLKALNDVLGDKKNEKEWFKCPKCGYQANGPVGDKCPNVVCGLTKQQYAKSGGKTC